MVSPLGFILTNTELESTVVKELANRSLVKFYLRYVDDTLLLVKDKDINYINFFR